MNYGERRLWQAVVIEALAELAGIQPSSDKGCVEHRQEKVKRWFFTNNRDFFYVCDLAGLCPYEIRSTAKEMMLVPHFRFWNKERRPSKRKRRSAR